MANREIKFRAWVKPGKMVYNIAPFRWDFCINLMFHKCIKSNGSGILGSGGSEATFELNGFSYADEASKDLMQYTGLKDKNGKEIFESDILQWSDKANNEPEQVMHTLTWDGMKSPIDNPFMSAWGSTCGKYFKCFMNIYDPTRYAEVIGNIYENPNLLTP